MGIIKHLKSILPLPKRWDNDDDAKKFGLRLEDAYRWLQVQRENDLEVSGRTIMLLSADNTWAKIWAKINQLGYGETATFFSNSTPYGILSGGVRSVNCSGTICRFSETTFHLFLKVTNAYGVFASLTSASSSGATYAETILNPTINNLTTTAGGYALDARQGKALNDNKLDAANVYNGLDKTSAGFALDARQGKVLNDKIRNDTIVYKASALIHRYTVAANSRNLVIFGGDGLSYTWIGYVYGNSSAGVTTYQIYAGSRIALVGTDAGTLSIQFSQASSAYLRNINLRGSPLV